MVEYKRLRYESERFKYLTHCWLHGKLFIDDKYCLGIRTNIKLAIL